MHSPWRSEYIDTFKSPPAKSGSLFSRIAAEKRDRQNLVVFRGDLAYIVMNRYPYNSGHLLIVPYRRVPSLEDLTDAEMLEIMKLTALSIKALTELFSPHGFNVGANLGRTAGAGIDDHVHFHVVPRWNGDTNFMPVLADVKMISQDMKKSWGELSAYFKRVQSKRNSKKRTSKVIDS